MPDLLPDNPPSPENGYTVDSTMEMSATLFNLVFGSIHDRLAAREVLEADFEALIAEGTSAALTMIQENIAPQIVDLQQAVQDAQDAVADLLATGTAPNAAKLGNQLPAYYLAPANFTVSADIKEFLASGDFETALTAMGVTAALEGLAGAVGEALEEKADTSQLADLLPLDGSRSMDGDLDMGGMKLLNADWSATPIMLSGVPVGAALFDPLGIGWPGFLEANGGSFDAEVYPDLAALYPSGVLPDFRNRVPRGAGTLAGAAGTTQEDAFQGHKVRIYNFNAPNSRGSGGDTNVWNVNAGMYVESNGSFYTDGTNGTPRVASETRVKAVVGKWFIKAYGAFVNTGEADLVAIEQAQQHMVRADAQTLSPEQKAQIGQNIGVLGVGQAWQDVTGSRAKDTTYTNTTGRMIVVSVVVQDPSSGNVVTGWINVDGTEVTSGSVSTSGNAQLALTANVPPGSTYSVGLGNADQFKYWRELRT